MPFVSNNGVKIHYEVEGQGPPLVLVPGFTCDARYWQETGYAQQLRKDYRLIMPDVRGHGESDKPHDPASYTPEMLAGDYVAVLDELGVKKANYFGYSLGGQIAFKAIARYAFPRLNSLIIGGATPCAVSPAEKDVRRKIIAEMEASFDQGIEAFLVFLQKVIGPLSPQLKARQMKNDPQALIAVFKSLTEWPGADDILSNITIPCLIFAGEADAFFSGAKECAAHLPDATFLPLPGLNHNECIRRSYLILPHIRKFLEEVNS